MSHRRRVILLARDADLRLQLLQEPQAAARSPATNPWGARDARVVDPVAAARVQLRADPDGDVALSAVGLSAELTRTCRTQRGDARIDVDRQKHVRRADQLGDHPTSPMQHRSKPLIVASSASRCRSDDQAAVCALCMTSCSRPAAHRHIGARTIIGRRSCWLLYAWLRRRSRTPLRRPTSTARRHDAPPRTHGTTTRRTGSTTGRSRSGPSSARSACSSRR